MDRRHLNREFFLQFLEDAEKARLDISPLSGIKVQDLVQKLYAAPKDVIVRARQAITP